MSDIARSLSLPALRLGLIVNPIAGMGGPLALKGTDGDLGDLARSAGAPSRAIDRATTALSALQRLPERVDILTGAGLLGETSVRDAGLVATLVHGAGDRKPTADDTLDAASRMLEAGVDIIVFAGGDGTARDILKAVGMQIPVLGIPAGVKMHSSIFATRPRTAGAILEDIAARPGSSMAVVSAEVLDRPDGDPTGSPLLYGALLTPVDGRRRQAAKTMAPRADDAAVTATCAQIARELPDDVLSIVGPGTTMLALKRALGIEGTLLGVDLILGGKAVALDADEATILRHMAGRRTHILLGIVGGQGFLFGRGNQQIGPEVIGRVGKNGITIVSSNTKLVTLPDARLLNDSGDDNLDRALAGFISVRVGPRQSVIMRVDCA